MNGLSPSRISCCGFASAPDPAVAVELGPSSPARTNGHWCQWMPRIWFLALVFAQPCGLLFDELSEAREQVDRLLDEQLHGAQVPPRVPVAHDCSAPL